MRRIKSVLALYINLCKSLYITLLSVTWVNSLSYLLEGADKYYSVFFFYIYFVNN